MPLNKRYHRNFPQEFILVPVMLEKHFMERIIKQCFLCGKISKKRETILSDKINEDKIYFTMKILERKWEFFLRFFRGFFMFNVNVRKYTKSIQLKYFFGLIKSKKLVNFSKLLVAIVDIHVNV